jgi:hypothetical protein
VIVTDQQGSIVLKDMQEYKYIQKAMLREGQEQQYIGE